MVKIKRIDLPDKGHINLRESIRLKKGENISLIGVRFGLNPPSRMLILIYINKKLIYVGVKRTDVTIFNFSPIQFCWLMDEINMFFYNLDNNELHGYLEPILLYNTPKIG